MKKAALFWSIFMLPCLLCSAGFLNFKTVDSEYYDVAGAVAIVKYGDEPEIIDYAYIRISVDNGNLCLKLVSKDDDYDIDVEYPLNSIKSEYSVITEDGIVNHVYSFFHGSDGIIYVSNEQCPVISVVINHKKTFLIPSVIYEHKSTRERNELFGNDALSAFDLSKWFKHVDSRINSLHNQNTPQSNQSLESHLKVY